MQQWSSQARFMSEPWAYSSTRPLIASQEFTLCCSESVSRHTVLDMFMLCRPPLFFVSFFPSSTDDATLAHAEHLLPRTLLLTLTHHRATACSPLSPFVSLLYFSQIKWFIDLVRLQYCGLCVTVMAENWGKKTHLHHCLLTHWVFIHTPDVWMSSSINSSRCAIFSPLV